MTQDDRSIVFLTMPTSGTGSLWRLMEAMAGGRYRMVKVAEQHMISGRGDELPDWVPEPRGHLYMYNTPHVANPHLDDPGVRLILNLRDPRDLSCNQYHWALQHPAPDKTPEELQAFRARVRARGVDDFVLGMDNNGLLRAFRAVAGRLGAEGDTDDVLRLSYAQLCLDFDAMAGRLAAFLGADPATIPRDRVERERVTNLPANPAWIGKQWSGSDLAPGRHRTELRPETVIRLDAKYRDALAFMSALERPELRPLLATGQPPPAPSGPALPAIGTSGAPRTLVGRDGQLFLTNDTNGVVDQITGRRPLPRGALFEIAALHRARAEFGRRVGRFDYGHLIVPNKECVLRAQLPPEVRFEAEGPRPMRQYLDSPAAALWRPWYKPGVLAPAGGESFFPRTDTHWNHAGAIRYVAAFLRARHPDLADALDTVPLRRFGSSQAGDLGGKLGLPPEPVEIVAPLRPRAELVFHDGLNATGGVRWYRNPHAASRKRAIVLHDSFGMWLFDLLAELFREVLFYRAPLLDFAAVERFAPDIVLCEQVERFLIRPPVNGGSMTEPTGRDEARAAAARSLAAFWADATPETR